MRKIPSLAVVALFFSAALFAAHGGSHSSGSHGGGSHGGSHGGGSHGGGSHGGGSHHGGGGHHDGGHHGGRHHGGWNHGGGHYWGWNQSYGWTGPSYWGGWWLPCDYDAGCGLVYDSEQEDWTMVEAEGSASLVLAIDPPDSVIYLEDHFLAPGQEVIGAGNGVPLAPGKHTITAARPGYQNKTVEIDVAPGESKQVELSLAKSGP
jgi:hypothetical protein